MKIGKVIIQRQNIVKMNIYASHVYIDTFFARVIFCQNGKHFRIEFPYNTRKEASKALQMLRDNTPKNMPKTVCEPFVFPCNRQGAVRYGWSPYRLALENRKSRYLS